MAQEEEPEIEVSVEEDEEDIVENVEQLNITADPPEVKTDDKTTKAKVTASANAARKKRLSKIKQEMNSSIKLTDLTDAIVTKPKPKRTTIKEVKDLLEKEKAEKDELKAILLNMRAEMDRQTKEREQEKEMKKAKKLAKVSGKIEPAAEQKSTKQIELEKSIALYRQRILGIQ